MKVGMARFGRLRRRFHDRYLERCVFVHINKTGGTSVGTALGLRFEHRTAEEKRAELGERSWSRKFRFAFVRNPWDRVASHYCYRVKTDQTGLGSGRVSFDEWTRLAYRDRDPTYCDKPKMFMPQLDWITDSQGRVLVDFIGRFESLDADFASICEHLAIRATLPHMKSSNKNDYRLYYDDESVGIVARCFARDIAQFGYTF